MAAGKKRSKREASTFAIPQSADEITRAIAEIGQHQRERDRIQAAMNDDLAIIRQKYEEEAEPHKGAIEDLTRGVQLWCEAHREALTQSGKVKRKDFPSGEVKWRLRPPSVTVRGMATVIEALKFLKLERFLRIKEEVNKEAILAEPEAVKNVKGISIAQAEDFIITPFETELEEVAV